MCNREEVNFLCELDSLKYGYSVSSTGKLHLHRALPCEISTAIPDKFIPKSIIHMHNQYQAGELTKSTEGATRYYDKIKLLRRYRLILPKKVNAQSPMERRAQKKEYLREWRKRNSRPASLQAGHEHSAVV